MVLPDIHLETKQNATQTSPDGISDRHYLECRLMSFVLDILFFYPFISLISHLYSGSLLFKLCMYLVGLSILKTLSMIFWHFTPGQSLMKLKIVAEEKSFIYLRYFFREILVSLSALCVFVPILSLFKNSQRQHYIDSFFGLNIVMQGIYKTTPVYQIYSTQFLKSILRLQFVLSATSLFLVFSLAYQSVIKNQDKPLSQNTCLVSGLTDLKSYVFLYLNHQIDNECLIYQSVFSQNTNQGYWKNVANYLTDKSESEKNKHIDRACSIYPESELCSHFEMQKRQPAAAENKELSEVMVFELVSKDLMRF